jgi:hypothetical protein
MEKYDEWEIEEILNYERGLIAQPKKIEIEEEEIF